MKNEITIDKVLIINNMISMLLLVILLFVHYAVWVYIFQSYSFSHVEGLAIAFLALTITIALYVVIRRRLSNIWVFWAFSRVNNVHELKKRLLTLVEITEEDTFLKKIENSTEYNMKYWKLRLRFEQEHIFVDDETIPEETVIFVLEGHQKFRKSQLILNSKGIFSKKVGFHKWEEIWFYIISGNSLIYNHSNGGENVKFAYNKIKLSKLLWVYSERNKLQNNRKQ